MKSDFQSEATDYILTTSLSTMGMRKNSDTGMAVYTGDGGVPETSRETSPFLENLRFKALLVLASTKEKNPGESRRRLVQALKGD